jgi:glycosyltransferase involved in cell wall biosynthesis
VTDAVLVPSFNEAGVIESVLDDIRVRFDGVVIVVDDGSTDGTSELLAVREDLTVFQHEANMGYGQALIDGFTHANDLGCKRVVTMDADGQHEPAHIDQFLAQLGPECDVISGSRYHPSSGALGEVPKDRLHINRVVTEEVNRVTGWGITDAFCGFKAYCLKSVLELELREPGYAMCMEFWAKAWLAGKHVREVPIERIYLDHSRSFGLGLENADDRLSYYLRVWRETLATGGR